jgi:putative nucleotidyltransferase with HDIG domain
MEYSKHDNPNLDADAAAILIKQLEDLGADEDAPQTNELTIERRWNGVREAQKLIVEAKSTVAAALNRIQQGDSIDVLSMRKSVQGIVSSVITDESSLLSLATLNRKYDRVYTHSVNVAIYLMALYKSIGKTESEIHDIGVIGLLHDVGMSKIPEEIANKKGTLTLIEKKIIASHVELSVIIMERHGVLNQKMMDVVSQHHEFLDGSGQPKGLKAEALSWEGRAAAIVDRFDNVNSLRKAARGNDPHAGLRHLVSLGNEKFDTGIIELFIKCIGVYPVGSIVKLTSGSVGVVALINRNTLLFPVVKIVQDQGKKPLASEKLINLNEYRHTLDYKIISVLPSNYLGKDPAQILMN